MESQQMIELLLKEMKTMQEKGEADRKAAQERLVAKMDTNQAKAGARHEEMMADWRAWREEMRDKRVKDNHHNTLACQEMEARQVEMKPEATEEEEVPAEDAEEIPVGEPKKKRRRDRKLASKRRR
jgi:hypothetical protein